MHVARSVEPSISPLDEELNLLPGGWTPLMHESMVRLGTWLPFDAAARELGFHRGMTLDGETVRRNTERAGKLYMPEQERVPDKELAQVPERQAISLDGSFVPLNSKEWVEAKMLTISTVNAARECTDVSYFARTAPYGEFSKQARGEVARRGVKKSAEVCAVADGADWIQSVVADHRTDALRILDFYHSAERLAGIGHALFDPDKTAFDSWFGRQRLELRDGDPDTLLSDLYQLSQMHPEHASLINEHLEYFAKRRSQIDYNLFKQAGWPIGSGSGEAAHKVVVQARMKQAGMRWAIRNVNPMLAVRALACNDRWDAAWTAIAKASRRPSTPPASPPAKLLPSSFVYKPLPGWRWDDAISTKS